MATEPTLRHLFGETPEPAIDVSSVIRRSRARRAPRMLGAGAVAVLAVCTVAYGGFAGLSGFGSSMTASDSGGAAPMAESMESSKDDMTFLGDGSSVSVGELFRCGEPVPEIPPSELGVVLAMTVPSVVDAGAASFDATVSIVNEGPQPVVATASSVPAFALTSGGIVVARSAPGPMELPAHLEPGESYAYGAVPVSLSCDGEPVPAGDYEVHAAIDISAVSGRPLAAAPTQRLTVE